MQIVKKYQDELYAAILSLTCSPEKSRELAVRSFEKVLGSYHEDSHETKLKLFKTAFSAIGVFSVKKKKLNRKGLVNSVKHKLKLADKKAFVLKFECGFTTGEISRMLGISADKVKKSLLQSTELIASALEENENEM